MAVTVSDRRIVVLGPIKAEIANISSVDDTDTFVSQLQAPKYAFFVPGTDTNGAAPQVNCAIGTGSAANLRTITFNNSTLSATIGVLVVIGF